MNHYPIRTQAVILFFLLLFLPLLMACTQQEPSLEPIADEPASDVTPATDAVIEQPQSPTALPPTVPPSTVTPRSTEASTGNESSHEPPDEANQETSMLALPEPTLFDVGWDERSLFASGLIAEQQPILNNMLGATVYHLDLEIAKDMLHLNGQQEVRYTNQEEVPLNEIYFRLFPNLLGGMSKVSDIRINGAPVEPSYELEESAMRLSLTQPLQPGEQLVIQLTFAVEVPPSSEGNYGSFAFVEDVLALAHFYPFIPVYDDEGWNLEIAPPSGDIIYADTSFYLVRMIAPSDVIMIGSGIKVAEERNDEQQTLTFAAGAMRDFYLVGSERYTLLSETVGETTVNSYTFDELTDVGQETLDIAVNAVQIFNERIGPYPFTELDVAVTPNLALGIEYPGVVVITLRLYNPEGPNANLQTKNYLESTVAHEVGHQWFYSTVGNDQLDEPWLDESLTQYITYLYYQERYGSGEAALPSEEFYQSLEQRSKTIQPSDIPIGLPVASYTPIEYSAIIYGRGPIFFDELAKTMGQEPFNAFLRDYYQSYQYGISTTEGLKIVAEVHCECDLTPLFEEWVYEK